MAAAGEFPRLREHRRTNKAGETTVYFFWDGRTAGIKDIPLGSDREMALRRYADCEKGIFPLKGRSLAKRLPVRQPGKRRKVESDQWQALPASLRRMYLNAERRASENRKSFTLTPDEFLRVVARANGHCELTGIPFEDAGSRHPFSPSIDRINSAIGYEYSNVRLICCIGNLALNDWGIEPLKRFAEALLRKGGL